MKKRVIGRAPLRIGLAGGGTDIEEYFSAHQGHVVNITIKLFAYTVIEKSEKNILESIDLGSMQEIPDNFSNVTSIVSKDLRLIFNTFNYLKNKFKCNTSEKLWIRTYTDAPPGSGLGSSSALVISMIVAYCKYMNLSISKKELAEEAYHIERHICGIKGGYQDQIASAYGGLNSTIFTNNGWEVSKLIVPKTTISSMETSLILHFSGVSRNSSNIINDQVEAIKKRDIRLDSLHEIKLSSERAKLFLEKGDLDGFYHQLSSSWEAKKKTSKLISNDHIDKLLRGLRKIGIYSAKVSGAGGGGFLSIFSPVENKKNIIAFLQENPGKVVDANFYENGADAWRE